MKLKLLLIAIALFVGCGSSYGQIAIPSSTPVTQNFDGLGSSGTATLPSGIKVNNSANYSTGATATTLAYGTTGTGAVTGTSGGGCINWANGVTASSTDRSLGFLTNGSSFQGPRSIIIEIKNTGSTNITDLTIAFDYEKYRSGSRQFDWTFFHGATAIAVNTAAAAGNQSYAADANNTVISNPPTSVSKTVTLTGLSIAPNGLYYLCWTFTGLSGSSNSQGIGIDNLSLTATFVSTCTDPSLAFATSSYSKNVGDANFTQTASTSSAGTVTYSSSDAAIATVNSSTGEVTIGTAGTATITATQVANGIYCVDTATYTVVVTSTAPSITASGALSALSTTYGTASSTTSFSVSGANLTGNILITAPTGFEVSTSSSSGFGNTLTLNQAGGTVASTTIYVRLAATTAIGTYSGDLTLASTGVTTVNVATASSTVSSVPSCIPPIWEENFDYGSCDNANLPNITSIWTRFSGSGNDAKYSASGLTYATYPSSGIGGSFSFETGGSDDIQRTITTLEITSGSVYASFLVNFNSNTTTDDYFAGFRNSNGTYGARVFVQKSGTQLKLGISKSQTTSDVTTGLLNFDTTYLVVVKYTILAGSVNDTFKLWVFNSDAPSTETIATSIFTPLNATASNTDAIDISTFYLRQTNKAKGYVDGIRVATNWESLFCGTTPTATTYTWTGTSSNSWANSGNWSPSGIPSSIDNIIINSAGTNTLNITDCRTVKDFTLNGIGTFAASATGVLTINGNITYSGTATATLDCASQIFIKSATPQPVPPLTYGNLDVLGGSRVFSPTGIIKICSTFNVDATLYTYTVTGSTVEYISSITGWEMSPFTYNNVIFSGTGAFSFGLSSPAANKDFTVLGNFLQSAGSVDLGQTASRTATLNIEGNMTISGGTFGVNRTSGSIGIVNLKGDLSVSNTAQLTGSYLGGSINFMGNGNGTTEELTQTIDIKNTNSVYYTTLSVNSGFVKLANQDLYLGTNSSFEVKSGAIFNFGYAADNVTALNIVRVNSRIGQNFNANSGSTIKLTSPLGITTSGTYTGNVQVGAAAANRTFDAGATYHYIGKANQVTGNGLPNAAANKHIIVELDADNLEFTSNNGIIRFNNPSTAIGTIFRGLEIRKGTVIADDSGARFDDGATGEVGNLKMSGGIYKIFTRDVQPAFNGNYDLSAGSKIIFAHTTAASTTQGIRGATSYQYPAIEIEGRDVRYSNVGINMKSNGLFTVKENAILTNTGNVGQIVSLDDANPATLIVKNLAIFKTEKEKGFNGAPDGINPSPSVRTNHTSGNVIVVLEAGSTVEYSRNGNQIITLVGYSNLTVSGTETKTLSSNTLTTVGNNLSVNASTLLIESGKALTVTNKVDVNTAATMTINDSGSLVQVNDAAVNSGNIRYERTTPLVRNTDYTYWSSPVADYTLGGVSQNLTVADKYYSYNSAVDDWQQASAATPMIPGIGYIIRGPEPIGPIPPGTPDIFEAFFVGKPNNGEYKISGLSLDKSYLLGNPYPSALDAETFLNANAGVLNGTLYFWTHNTDIQLYTDIITAGGTPGTGVLAYTSDDYAAYNATGGVAVTQRDIDPNTGLPYPGPSPSGSLAPSGKIASGQGFFASTKTTLSGSPIQILYNNSMRVGVVNILNENNSQFFKTKNPQTKTAAIEKHRIWLNLRNTQGVFKQTLIGYLTDATNQYDSRFDGETFDGNEFVDFYSINQDKNLVIQGRSLPFDENDEIPLGFRTTIEGPFTINIDQVDGLLTNQAVFIEDKLTNTVFDLKTGNYTFNTAAGTFNDRFVLRYTNKTLGTKDLETLENQVLVSNKNKQIQINSNTETIDKIMVYDLLGRLLFKKDKVNSNELAIPNLFSSQQTLLVKVILQNGQTVTKKIMY